MKTLFLLKNGLGEYYVVANDPTEAQDALEDMLRKSDYGFSDKRKTQSIEIIDREMGEFPKGKPNFSSGNNLIILKDGKEFADGEIGDLVEKFLKDNRVVEGSSVHIKLSGVPGRNEYYMVEGMLSDFYKYVMSQ